MNLELIIAAAICIFAAAMTTASMSSATESSSAPLHPRPNFHRSDWISLDGKWDFSFDDKDSGIEEKWFEEHDYNRNINVPYPYQAKLSGIGETENHKVVWYHRQFDVPSNFGDKQILLHIGAADYAATVWVNGTEVGHDKGGYVPFTFDVTGALHKGQNDLTIRVFDDPHDGEQPRGKQGPLGRDRFFYTHVSGIWQPVWLEPVPKTAVQSMRIIPRLEPKGADISVSVSGENQGDAVVRATILRDGKDILTLNSPVVGGKADFDITIPNADTWSPEHPALYDLKVELLQAGSPIDCVYSYFGIRTVDIKGTTIRLNGKPIWLNTALAQGYWPDGIYVPPSPDDYRKDVMTCKELGLNGIRMHQKVEDPRFLYWCDKLGLLVWGEMANAADGCTTERAYKIADAVWERTIERDFNHPCIITWVYSNENWMHRNAWAPDKDHSDEDAAEVAHYLQAYHKMKKLDPTRPVIDTSGLWHVKTDIFDVHVFPDPADVEAWKEGKEFSRRFDINFSPMADRSYQEIPFVVSEWVYADDFEKADEAFYKGYDEYLRTMLGFGICPGHSYIQLYDVENELNGYMTYDRKWKVDPKRIAKIHKAVAESYLASLMR